MRVFSGVVVLGIVQSSFAFSFSTRIVDQGPLDRTTAMVAINNHGDAVGEIQVSRTEYQACIIRVDGSYSVLRGREGWQADSWGVDDRGTVIGTSYNATLGVSAGAYWTANGAYNEIPLLPGGTFTNPAKINNRGWIAGYANGNDGGIFIYRDGQMVPIGRPPSAPGYQILSFSDNGRMVGIANNDITWFWDEVSGFTVFPGLPNTEFSLYLHSNNNGMFAGLDYHQDPHQSWIWTELNGVRTYTGFAGVIADFNHRNEFLGRAYGYGDIVYRNGIITRLADHEGGYTSLTPFDLNDRGQILVYGNDATSTKQLIFTPVPEPSAFVTFGAGLGLLAWNRRSRSHRK